MPELLLHYLYPALNFDYWRFQVHLFLKVHVTSSTLTAQDLEQILTTRLLHLTLDLQVSEQRRTHGCQTFREGYKKCKTRKKKAKIQKTDMGAAHISRQ